MPNTYRTCTVESKTRPSLSLGHQPGTTEPSGPGTDRDGGHGIEGGDLKDFMRKAGEVTYVDAHRANRNEGVVEFASYSDMKNAIEKLDGLELSGRKIRLSEDRKRNRSRSKSRSYSRSRSKSKSRGTSRSLSRSRSRTPEKKYGGGEPSQTPPKRQSRSSSRESRD